MIFEAHAQWTILQIRFQILQFQLLLIMKLIIQLLVFAEKENECFSALTSKIFQGENVLQ